MGSISIEHWFIGLVVGFLFLAWLVKSIFK